MRDLLDPTTTQTRANANAYSVWFVLVTALFVTCLITANIIAVKLVSLGGLILPAAIIVFPLSYIIGAALTLFAHVGHVSCCRSATLNSRSELWLSISTPSTA